MIKKIGVVTVVVMLLVIAGIASARAAEQRFSGRVAGLFLRHLMNDLDITDDQRVQIKQIMVEERPAIVALLNRLDEQNQQLRANDTFDEEHVRALAREQSQTLTELIVERERVRTRVMSVLTPAQREKAHQLRDEFRESIRARLNKLGDEI